MSDIRDAAVVVRDELLRRGRIQAAGTLTDLIHDLDWEAGRDPYLLSGVTDAVGAQAHQVG